MTKVRKAGKPLALEGTPPHRAKGETKPGFIQEVQEVKQDKNADYA